MEPVEQTIASVSPLAARAQAASRCDAGRLPLELVPLFIELMRIAFARHVLRESLVTGWAAHHDVIRWQRIVRKELHANRLGRTIVAQ